MSELEHKISALEDRVRRLEDTADIYRLIATYGPAVDSGSDAVAGGLWTESGVYDLGSRRLEGAGEVAAMVRGDAHQGLIQGGAAHVLAVPLVRIDGDRAVATGYSNVYRYVNDAFEVWRTAANRWELERTPDGWRVTCRTTRLLDGNDLSRDILRRAVEADTTPLPASDP